MEKGKWFFFQYLPAYWTKKEYFENDGNLKKNGNKFLSKFMKQKMSSDRTI